MSKQKPNISPSLIGELFLKPGDNIPYRLIRCDTEPIAVMHKVTELEPQKPQPISELKDFQLLKPVVPRVRIKPEPKIRKTRSDAGKPRERKPKAEPIIAVISGRRKRRDLIIEDEPEIADIKAGSPRSSCGV